MSCYTCGMTTYQLYKVAAASRTFRSKRQVEPYADFRAEGKFGSDEEAIAWARQRTRRQGGLYPAVLYLQNMDTGEILPVNHQVSKADPPSYKNDTETRYYLYRVERGQLWKRDGADLRFADLSSFFSDTEAIAWAQQQIKEKGGGWSPVTFLINQDTEDIMRSDFSDRAVQL